MTTTPNKWTFWFFWIAGNTLAWGLGFVAGFAFYWWVGERDAVSVFALPMVVIVFGFQWGILRYLLRGHPAYEKHPEKYVPIGLLFGFVTPIAVLLFLGSLSIASTSNDLIPDIFSPLNAFFILMNNFIVAEFFATQRSPFDKDIPPYKAMGTLVFFVICGVLGWQFSKLLPLQPDTSSNEFATLMVWNLLLGNVLGLIYSVSSLWGLRAVWNYEALGDGIFFNINGKTILKNRRQSRWVYGGFFVLLMGWSIWVALRPCNGLDRILERSGCMEQIRDIGERRLGLATVSQDGKWLAYTVDGRGFTPEQITLWNLEEHRGTWVANLPDGLGFLSGSPEFSPDGKLLAFLHPPYYDESGLTTNVWLVADGQFVETITRAKLPREITLTPSGDNTFTFNLSAQQLWDWILRNPVILQNPSFEMTVQNVVSRPNRWFIIGKVADKRQIWKVENGLLSQVYELQSGESYTISTDGEMIAITNLGENNEVKIISLSVGTIYVISTENNNPPSRHTLEFALNESVLVTSGFATQEDLPTIIYRLSDGQILQNLPTKDDDNGLFLPSGKDYYILQTDRAFQLWRLPSPQP